VINWTDFIKQESEKDYYKKLVELIIEDSKKYEIYPPRENLFNAFKLTQFDKVKVVILSQDPYHGPNQAHGLAFSVQSGSIPPSLQNIFKELKNDLNIDTPKHGCLKSWAEQGVLLLNSTLTVRKGEPNSHKDFGWSNFTDETIKQLNLHPNPLVFILWGKFAQSKTELISNKKHLILRSVHPSPYSVNNGFFGSRPFSKANNFLKENDIQTIDWNI
jgi:uracil-DNA glycosylase